MTDNEIVKRNTIDFSGRDLFKLILPLVVEQFLAILVGFADSSMVARVGEAAVSAVSLVDTVNVLLINTFTALATGGAVVAGQYIGRREPGKADKAADQLLLFMLAVSVVVTAALFAMKHFILNVVFGAIEPDVMGYANTYFVIVECSIPFIALYSVGAAIFRVMGNSAVSMNVALLMNGINVAGNAVLIFVVKMGVEGVAIPTLVSRAVAAVVVLALLRNQSLKVHISRKFVWRFDKKAVGNIVRLGVPNGIENSLFQLGKILLLSVASAFGTASIAANAIANTITGFQVLGAQSIGVGMVTVVSQCVGAGEYGKARFYTRKLMIAAYAATFVLNGIIFLLLPGIIKIYGVSDEASRLARIILLMHGGMSILLWPLSFTLPQTLKGAGDTRFTMVVAIASMWVFRIMFGIWFARGLGFGVLGIWMSMFIDWACRIVFYVVRYRGHKWESKALKE